MRAASLLLLAVLASPSLGQSPAAPAEPPKKLEPNFFTPPETAQTGPDLRYAPASNSFVCDLPGAEWVAFEDEEAEGAAVHILGPDNPDGLYRPGIDVRLYEKGHSRFLPMKTFIDRMRRSDDDTGRQATGVRPQRIGGILLRLFEVNEKRWLPVDRFPAAERDIHHFVAVVPAGDSYFVIKLGSTRETYLEYRSLFVNFIKSFRPQGYR